MRASVPAAALFACVACGIFASAACELSAKVGELSVDSGAEEASTFPPENLADGAAAPKLTWRLRAPIVPCSIYAMGEARADALYVGCNGGRIYRFDGVSAELAFEIEDTRVFSLLWVAGDGTVWAGAQSSAKSDATTQLYRFDGKTWTKVGADDARVMSLTGAGVGGADVWVTTKTEIRHFDGTHFTKMYTLPDGEFRACTFSSATKGFCSGTGGSAVAWDGQNWSTMPSVPWSAQAEVFGVEVTSASGPATFFYGEPITDPHGDHSVRAAKWDGASFTTYAASIPKFTSYSRSRTRTGQVNVGGRTYMLLALDESFGHALIFDAYDDAFRPLCGPVLAFSAGTAKTRVGGFHGLLATIVGSGGNQIALTKKTDSFDFSELSVAEDGAAWARVEDPTACDSVTARLARLEEDRWLEVAAPQPMMSGRGLAAISRDHAYTLTIADETLAEFESGSWTERPTIASPWTLSAKKRNDVWIGTFHDQLAHDDGKAFGAVVPEARGRQILQVVTDGTTNVWSVALGYTQEDTNVHVYRWADGKRTEWDLGINRMEVRIGALDAMHVWMSGAPAKVWDGAGWKDFPFDATGVWARSPEEVYFTYGGDIHRWDGVRRERVYHGFIPIWFIDGAKNRAVAVGPGGLTVELAAWANPTK